MFTEKSSKIRGTAKDRILSVATELFYRQGYNGTGIQQIIDEACVAKGTFYTHFKTKEDLGLAYMRQRSSDEATRVKNALTAISNPYDKYIQLNQIMKHWMAKTNYRGCAFSNMAAEVPDGRSPIRKEAKYHYEAFRVIIRDVVENLLKSDRRYKNLDIQYVADQYLMIQVGALTNSEIYQDTWPYDHADKFIRELIGEKK